MMMQPTRTAFGLWNGGRFVQFGRKLQAEHVQQLIRKAYDGGIRTFVTADTYACGEADRLLGQALDGIPRDSYCLAGMVGHDFYHGNRSGFGGWSRFTDPALRAPIDYTSYLEMATQHSLELCSTCHFDLLMLHNPDSIGYTSEDVWAGLERLRQKGMTRLLGVAPGPANGFALDLIHCFEKFGDSVDWAMLILNPLEPWPMNAVLPAAQKHNVAVMARVVECGGLFHDDVQPEHEFSQGDHRRHRPHGWLETGWKKLEQMRPIAERHSLTMLQLACLWTLQQPSVRSLVPTLMEEVAKPRKPIEQKMEELAGLPTGTVLSTEELQQIDAIGDNCHCPAFSQRFKGASPLHEGSPQPDRWCMTPELEDVANRWDIELEDLDTSLRCLKHYA